MRNDTIERRRCDDRMRLSCGRCDGSKLNFIKCQESGNFKKYTDERIKDIAESYDW